MGGANGQASSSRKAVQDPPIKQDLPLSLKEVFEGCTKKMKITRRRLNPDRQSSRLEEKVLEVEIKKGWKAGTQITFEREGDERPGRIPANIVFVIKDKPDKNFVRDGNDLKYTATITLKQALCGGTITIPNILDGGIQVTIRPATQPNSTQRLSGRGLPLSKEPSKFGDIVVTFKVVLPTHLSSDRIKQLQNILPDH